MLVLKRILSGVAAGLVIGIGGTVYLSLDKTLGAIMFSVALLCICYKGYSLFTGKVGFIAHSRTKKDLSVLFCGLLGNIVGAAAAAMIVAVATDGALMDRAHNMAIAKFGQSVPETLLRAFMCGVLMYLAVSIFSKSKSPLGVIFCIPTFIFCGFEHSIADVYYLFAGFESTGTYLIRTLAFIALVLVGNALGAIVIALFDKTKEVRDE